MRGPEGSADVAMKGLALFRGQKRVGRVADAVVRKVIRDAPFLCGAHADGKQAVSKGRLERRAELLLGLSQGRREKAEICAMADARQSR